MIYSHTWPWSADTTTGAGAYCFCLYMCFFKVFHMKTFQWLRSHVAISELSVGSRWCKESGINVLSETQFPHLPNESGDCKVVWSMQELVCVTCCVYTQQGHITYKPQMNCIWLLSCLWYRWGPGCSLSLSRANLFYILKPNEELE